MELFTNDPLLKSDNLLKRFEEIHDFIYANDGLSPQQTLEEFIKILFIKVFDEGKSLGKFSISTQEWQQLSAGTRVPNFLERQELLFEETKKVFREIFETDDRIRLSPTAMGFTVNKLQSISLMDAQQDAKGLAFQKFLSHHEKKGSGQFFTPSPVIDFCVKMINPKPYETVIDPACGSGGFLMSALKHVCKSKNEEEGYVAENLFGIDINRSIARIAKLKLLLEANVANNIHCGTSLDDLDAWKLNLGVREGFDVVLTNPPFGAKISSPALLSRFDLGYKWSLHDGIYFKTAKHHANQSAETLFIERCIQLLKPGGRMAIVLPNGNFENPSLDYIRYYVRLLCRILAIVKLPQETFVPYGTAVKTSLMFLQKKEDPSVVEKNHIFFGEVKKVGYQGNRNGTPIYVRDSYGRPITDEHGRQVIDEDFSSIVSAYRAFESGAVNGTGSNTFVLGTEALNGRLDYDFYSPENRTLIDSFEGSSSARLGDLCEMLRTKSSKLRTLDAIVDYVELSDVNTHSFEIINATTLPVCDLPSRASYELRTGDIITAVAGNSIGTRKHATALVTDEYAGAVCTNGFRVLRNLQIDPYYLLYFMKTEAFLKQIYMYRTGAAIPNVSDIDLANIWISLPKEKTMEQISSKVRQAFQLRTEAKETWESLENFAG